MNHAPHLKKVSLPVYGVELKSIYVLISKEFYLKGDDQRLSVYTFLPDKVLIKATTEEISVC